LSAGYGRMKNALFNPFDLKKWFIVGFTAFLAGLLDGGGNGGNSAGRGNVDDFADVLEAPYMAWNWLLDNPNWTILIGFGVLFLFAFLVVVTWVSSRGKFMFLDNIVHDRALIKQPWFEYKNEGNSLFIWRMFYGLFCFALVIMFLYNVWQAAYNMYYDDYSFPWMFFIRKGLLFILMILVLSYIELMLNAFVITLMYKHRIAVTKAWSTFLTLHWAHLMPFILFSLLWLVLSIGVFILVVLAGLLTCCFGFLLLIIPYINSVVLLPISYTLSSFNLYFFAQFGEKYNVFSIGEASLDSNAVG
jgi:hypothetical protein